MDFDSRFDCCKVCNSVSLQCQNNRSPRQIQGQGDCKYNAEGNKSCWKTVDKGKTQRKCVRDCNSPESNTERPKNFLDGHCSCFPKQDFPDKLNREPKQENYETSNYFWDSPSPNWTLKSETFFIPEKHRSNYANPDKLLAENILEFEEKVDFLFRIFKDYGQKFPPEGYIEQAQARPGEGMFKDFAHLFNFNKRLCAAEEGIEKLALILEDLVRESSKKKPEENHGDFVDFDEMSVSQRINYLKSRNDLMLSFMKAFLKSGSAEEYYTKSVLLPNDLKQVNVKLENEEKHQNADLNYVKIMETLQQLRIRMTELRPKKSQLYTEQHKTKNEKTGETVTCTRNKLEMISEQAELALSDDSENALDDFGEKGAVRLLSEKLAEINEESDESDFSIQDVTLRILPQGAELLKPPLEKLYSKMDSPEKKFLNGNNIQISLKEENQQGDVPLNYNSAGELSCIFCEGEKSDKTRKKVYTNQKEQGKRGKNSSEKLTKDPCKQNISKKGEECLEGYNQSGRKILREENYVVFPGKGSRAGCSVPELYSPSREERKRDVRRKEQRQRPMTDPSPHRKTLLASKPPLPEKCATRNSGINNVKNKNKILLSKKSCVQTS